MLHFNTPDAARKKNAVARKLKERAKAVSARINKRLWKHKQEKKERALESVRALLDPRNLGRARYTGIRAPSFNASGA